MTHYLVGVLTGLILAGSVASAQWLTPQELRERQEQQHQDWMQQLQYSQQLQQNAIQQQMLRELQKPCY